MTPPAPVLLDDRLCAELARDPQLTLLLDLDGTLIPFAPTAEAAVLDAPAIQLLEGLQNAGARVVIVTGRPRRLVEPLRGAIERVTWIAEHGSWHCDETGVWTGPKPVAELDEVVAVLRPFQAVPGARVETKSLSVCLHWRLVPPALKDDFISGAELMCDEWLESHPDFERLDGVEMLELRHRSTNKGAAVAWVRARVPEARIIAIGDDETDEDMFAALRDTELAIGVGPQRERTTYWLPDPAAVRAFLGWLTEMRMTGAARPFGSLTHRETAVPSNARLVVVSNRTPPTTSGRQRAVGGLVSALEPALRAHDGLWLGWSGGEAEGERRLAVADDTLPVRASFEFPRAWREHFYAGFCNRALWPLFHGFPGRVSYSDIDWNAYVAANDEFARHANELVAADGTVWMHDYHLLLAGRALRERGFRGPLGLFLHIPFPQVDLFDTLPWAAEILDAMLAFDLLGFHTEQWAENFRACARAHGRVPDATQIGVLPIGVDPAAFQGGPTTIDREVAGLQALMAQRRMILGVDRLDYAKGIPERLLGFECLLETTPEWRGKVSFVQISVPSRSDVPEYAELRHRVDSLVGRINGRFGEADWVPVRYLYRSYDHQILSQLYRLADIGLVTPLRDGLNLVAKEFVVAQDAANPAVLVLSRFAGAAAELTEAVLTNPYHPDGLARDLDRALRMEVTERRRRHASLAAALADNTPQRWAAAFLEQLFGARRATA